MAKFRKTSAKSKTKSKQKKKKAAAAAARNAEAEQEAKYAHLPRSMVFRRGKVGQEVARLIHDLRKVLAPLSSEKLKESKKNDLKDFFHAAGLLNVSHFMILSQTAIGVNMRIARLPRGPTLTFRVLNYSTMYSLTQCQKRPHSPGDEFRQSPLLVLNGFSGQENHIKIMTAHLSSIFPPLDISQIRLANCRRVVMFNFNAETDTIEFRHYYVKVIPVGLTKGVRKVIKGKIPSLHNRRDIADYVENPATLSDSEAELPEESRVVTPQHISKINRVGGTSAIKLKEIGPRMTLQLVKIEGGACAGEVIYHAHITKSEAEKIALVAKHKERALLRAERRAIQEANVLRKQKLKEEKEQAKAEARAERQRVRALRQASGENDPSEDESEESSESESSEESDLSDQDGGYGSEEVEGGYYDDSDYEAEIEDSREQKMLQVDSEDDSSASEQESEESEESESEVEEKTTKYQQQAKLGEKRGRPKAMKAR